jgi:CRISPR/Cas system-associated exonuclease Cas4 (RecB family)
MKKMILTMVIAISSLAVSAREAEVNKKVLDAFKTEFTTARDVEWTVGKDFYKAAFIFNDKHVFAYYNIDGDLLGLTRYISPVDMPLNLQISLKEKSNGYWISDLFEMAKNGTTSYYLTIENAETKTVLKSTSGSDWEEFKTVKKS